MADALVTLGSAMVVAAYGLGVRRAWASAGRHRIVVQPQVASFLAGMAVVLIALVGPLDGAADRHLTAHMVQHVLLLSFAAPLLALGGGLPALLWALPAAARQRALRAWRKVVASHRGVGWTWWAVATITGQSLVMWAWHAPPLFDAAVRNGAVHAAEHLSFLVSSTVMWWALAAGHRSRRGAATLAVFVAAFPGTALGAALLLSPHPWYQSYVHVSVSAALSDQQMAGVVMWSLAGLVYVAAAAVLFGTWLAGQDAAGASAPAMSGAGAP